MKQAYQPVLKDTKEAYQPSQKDKNQAYQPSQKNTKQAYQPSQKNTKQHTNQAILHMCLQQVFFILQTILRFAGYHDSDYVESRLLGYKNPVRT
jgi:hypothetical protein